MAGTKGVTGTAAGRWLAANLSEMSQSYNFDVESLLRSPAYAGMTVQQAISKYAPPVESDSVNYVNLVCAWAACRPTDLLTDVLGS